MCNAQTLITLTITLFLEPKVTLLDLGEVGDGDVQTRLDRVYDELASFCKQAGLPLHMTGLTRHLLKFTVDADYPCGSLALGQCTI